MADHFDFDGVSIERFYNLVSKTDEPTFDLLDELGLSDKLHWVPTTMGFFNEGRPYPWGDPLSLLRFPLIGIFDKLRYGLFALVCVRRDRWPALENETAEQWIGRWCGPAIYQRFWKPLIDSNSMRLLTIFRPRGFRRASVVLDAHAEVFCRRN